MIQDLYNNPLNPVTMTIFYSSDGLPQYLVINNRILEWPW